MRFLAIDYGEKHMGLALSDSEGRIAFPYSQLEAKDFVTFQFKLQAIIKNEKVEALVVGLPVPLEGGENAMTEKVREFGDKLQEKFELPIEFENEVFSTKMATRGSSKERVDSSSAAIFLQSYLDKRNMVA